MYNLEDLLITFNQHAIKAKQNQKRMLKEYIENYGSEDIPDHMTDNFMLPSAFASMCQEILLIKKKLEILAKKQHSKK
jgi:hypothetical protein